MTSSRKRDDFKAAIRRLLAECAGYRCSNPECRIPTIGPKKGETGSNSIGIAAHIKAASIGGPRYDPTQSPEERKSEGNGIWLCASCSSLVDGDPDGFPVELLRQWKQDAKAFALRQIEKGRGAPAIPELLEDLIEELAGLRSDLGLPQDTDLADVQERVRAASLEQVEAFEAQDRWPMHAVELQLSFASTLEEDDSAQCFEQSNFGAVLFAARKIILLAAPGCGKTTTLVQIARKLGGGGPVPALVPLGEWAESDKDLFEWLAGRRGYARLSSGHLKFLAHHGELALLLDGWNEVPAGAQRRLIKEMEGLEREYPLLKVAMSSRQVALDVPLAGRRLSVLPLAEAQQIEIARAMSDDDGISVLDAAWRTVGLRDLVAIPLYLRSLMEISASGKFPETKEEILRRLVETHEAAPANKELFHRELHDAHRHFLTAIAVVAQKAGNPAIPEGKARSAVFAVCQQLLSNEWIASAPNPAQVLDVLVASHLLVRENGNLYAFQHQQLQEWFASFDFETNAVEAGSDLGFGHPLVGDVLNDRSWGEVVLFAVERMGRGTEASAEVAAKVIDLLLRIDPLFAALLVARAGPKVWDVVGDKVVRFARAWHTPGQLDRAVGFMITSKRPEFADIVWPLVSNDDGQIQMNTIRLVRRFNPAVLGDYLHRDYAALSDQSRETLVTELADHGDRDGIDTALALARSESSVAIRHSVFHALLFRYAAPQAEALLRAAGDDLAQSIAERGYLDGIRDPELLADLMRRRAALARTAATPTLRLAFALRYLPDSDIPEIVLRELKDPGFSFEHDRGTSWHEAWTRFPQEVAKALQWRIENGLKLPYDPFEYLEPTEPTDDGSIAALTLGDNSARRISLAPYLAGPRTVRTLVIRFLDAKRAFRADGRRTEDAYEPVRRIRDRLECTRARVLFDVLQEFGEGLAPSEIRDLADIVSRHGRTGGQDMPIPGDANLKAVEIINAWGWQLVEQSSSRQDMAELTRAMLRAPDPRQVPILERMLEADLAGLRAGRAAYEANRSDNRALDEMRISHVHEYRRILTMIGTETAEGVLKRYLLDPDFGPEAAVGLQVLWQQRHEPAPESRFNTWPDFERATVNRSRDRSETCDIAEILMEAAGALKTEGDPKSLARAAWYAGRAVLLPHGNRATEINEILTADIPNRARLALAQRMMVGGLIVPADTIMDGLKAAMSKHGDRKWIDENELRVLFDWAELLPMSDQPTAFLEALDMISSKFDFRSCHVRDLLRSTRHLCEVQRIELLRGLVTRYPDLTDQYELFLALTNPGEATLDFLLEITAGRYGRKPIEQVTRFDYPDELYQTLCPEARDGLAARLSSTRNAPEKTFLAKVLFSSGDHDVFLALAQDDVGRRIIAQFAGGPLSKVLYTHHSTGLGTSSYELIPRDLAPLRKGLFGLTRAPDAATADFAKYCLEQIDAELDKEGLFDTGPRHPDISWCLPWPDVAIEED